MQFNNVRYRLDFNIFPRYVKDKGIDFLYELLEKREQYLCDYFNIYYEKIGNPLFFTANPKRFSVDQFLITEKASDNGSKIIYISLPDEHEGSRVYCTAYAFVYHEENGVIDAFKMFTIEKSIFNTTCIAQMWDGQRINIGEATGSAEGDIAFLEKITGKGKQE